MSTSRFTNTFLSQYNLNNNEKKKSSDTKASLCHRITADLFKINYELHNYSSLIFTLSAFDVEKLTLQFNTVTFVDIVVV